MDANRVRKRQVVRAQIKQISVRELENMAKHRRAVGDRQGADYLDIQALALLDKKICRKIIRQSRRAQCGVGGVVFPLINGISWSKP
jgi:hypothetical protein